MPGQTIPGRDRALEQYVAVCRCPAPPEPHPDLPPACAGPDRPPVLCHLSRYARYHGLAHPCLSTDAAPPCLCKSGPCVPAACIKSRLCSAAGVPQSGRIPPSARFPPPHSPPGVDDGVGPWSHGSAPWTQGRVETPCRTGRPQFRSARLRPAPSSSYSRQNAVY